MMTLLGRFVFQLQEPVGPAREVFQIRMTNDNSFTAIPLYIAHQFKGVVDIGDRLIGYRTHDFIGGNTTQAGYPITRLRGAVKGYQSNSISEAPVSDRIDRSLPVIGAGIYLTIESHASGQGITPMVREVYPLTAASPQVGAIPVSPHPVELFTGKPAVNGLAVPMEAVLHVLFVHTVTSLGCLASIGLQDSSEVNRYWRLFEGVLLGIRYSGSWPRYPYKGYVLLGVSPVSKTHKDTTTLIN